MTKYITLFALFLTLTSCAQIATKMKTPENVNRKFEEFIAKKKFFEQPYPNFYPGISDEKLRPMLTKKINEVAMDFKQISESDIPTEEEYQELIRTGLLKFPEIELGYDSEDRVRILLYFEEIMDIVGLKSSNGQLNKFMYGFDPTEKPKEKKWTDFHGNVFIEKGNEISIIPAKYNKTGKTHRIFIFNETSSEIGVISNLKIKPNEFKVFNLQDIDTLKLDNGVKFMFGETYGLEVEDKKSQVSGLGGEFLKKYGVPDEAQWAFVIVPVGEGDK